MYLALRAINTYLKIQQNKNYLWWEAIVFNLKISLYTKLLLTVPVSHLLPVSSWLPPLPCLVILELDPVVGCISPLSAVSQVKLASREDAGGWEKARLKQEETSFLYSDSRLPCRGPNNDHLGPGSAEGLPLAKLLYLHTGGCCCSSPAEPSGRGQQPCPPFRGLRLSLVGASSEFLGSSVVHYLSALGGMAVCSCHLCRPRVFFYPFRS